MSEEHRPLTSEQRVGVIFLTTCAVIILPATIGFLFNYWPRTWELTGTRFWIAITILIFATFNVVWSVGMIGATIFYCWKYIMRQRQARLKRDAQQEGQ